MPKSSTHPPTACKRIGSSVDFHTKSYSYRFECPRCHKGRRYNTNFLGNRFELVCDGAEIKRQRHGPWSDERMLDVAREIDQLNQQVEKLVAEIREVSKHPLASVIADELADQCIVIACAREIVEDCIARNEEDNWPPVEVRAYADGTLIANVHCPRGSIR